MQRHPLRHHDPSANGRSRCAEAPLRVLALEPFYGGSHRQLLDQWTERSRHRFTVLGLPASHWKWRMRHSAPDLARQVAARVERGERWDVVFCSDMLDLAAFRGLAPPAVRALPAVLYFHENQLTYPVQREEERDLHFALTNLVSALAASECWFNSDFHRRSFLEALPRLLRRMPDRRLDFAPRVVEQRSRVEWPGVESPLGAVGRNGRPRPPRSRGAALHLVWAARWEHDKGPELLFDALERIEARLPLRVSIVGQSFSEVPAVFAGARERLGERLGELGHLPRGRYLELLRSADVFLSTAHHEFFGLAAVEAVLAGARPLLPDRLSYPELLDAGGAGPAEPHAFLWSGDAADLAKRIEELARSEERLPQGSLEALVAAFRVFEWSRRLPDLDEGLERVARGTGSRVPASRRSRSRTADAEASG